MAKVTAVIDIGSNSARMAIFSRSSRYGFHLVEEARSRVRISEDSYQNGGILQTVPMCRAISALKEFRAIAELRGARKIFCVATSAVRDAPNASEFIARARNEAGIQIKVIDGTKEAFFGAIAALNLLPYRDGITIDIGGGSSECALIRDGKVCDLISLNIGTIRLKELFFDKKAPIKDALAFIKKELARIPDSFSHERIIGIGGTARTLSKLIMRDEEYPIDTLHGFEYLVSEYRDLFTRIYTADTSKLRALGIKDDRLDSIQGGALIFSTLLELFGSKEVVTSGVGVREGVFLNDLLRTSRGVFPHNFNPSVRSLIDRFCLSEKLGNRIKKISLKLFDALSERHSVDPAYKFHLGIAARLSDIGASLNYYDHHHHGSYLVLNSLVYGFSHKDRVVIALLVEYNNRKIPKDSAIAHATSLMPPLITLQWLSYILGLAECLSLGIGALDLECSYKNGTLTLVSNNDLYLAKESIEKLARPAPLNISFKKP